LVLGRFVNSTSGNDTLDLWINPSSAALDAYAVSGNLADLGAPNTGMVATVANITFGTNSGIYLRSGNTATTNWTFDELRIGTDFADVVGAPIPEPSAAAVLAGLGALVAVVSRRRRA
jgi:hypothetical protein